MIDGRTKLIGLIGDPVEHTKSPAIHNFIAQKLNDNVVYVPFHVKGEGLADAVAGAYDLGILGMNVTVPHKQSVMREACDVDTAALEIGAVNTLVRTENGYKGYNTDYLGFIRELRAVSADPAGSDVIVLGAGGAAKAVVYALEKLGAAHLYILNRSRQRAEEAFGGLENVTVLEYSGYAGIPAGRHICIQCTSVGLHPDDEACVMDDGSFFDLVGTGIDAIYNPEETIFMKRVREHGGEAYNGLKMLIYQAVASYELFLDRQVPHEIVDELYGELCGEIYE